MATKAIDSYLSYHKRCGEKLADTAPVFRTDFYAADLFKVRNRVMRLSTEGVSLAVSNLLRKAGLLSTTTEAVKRHEVQRNHGFRKFANTQMVQADLKGAAKEMLLGHSFGLDDKYYGPTPGRTLLLLEKLFGARRDGFFNEIIGYDKMARAKIKHSCLTWWKQGL